MVVPLPLWSRERVGSCFVSARQLLGAARLLGAGEEGSPGQVLRGVSYCVRSERVADRALDRSGVVDGELILLSGREIRQDSDGAGRSGGGNHQPLVLLPALEH